MDLITWNPDDKGTNITLSNNNLTAKHTTGNAMVRATVGKSTGKWYWETCINETTDVNYGSLIVDSIKDVNVSPYDTTIGQRTMYYNDTKNSNQGFIVYNSNPSDNTVLVRGLPIYNVGDILGVSIDLDVTPKKAKFYKNGIFIGECPIMISGLVYPACGSGSSENGITTANFGATPFYISNYAKELWQQLVYEGYAPYDIENANWNWKITKYLINQDNNYYSTKSNFLNLGQPTDNTQLENWYNKYGADDVNIITENLNNKEFPMSKSENGIWKTDFQLDMNDVTDNIDLVDTDENNKSIKYDCNDYRILDLCDDEFDIMQYKKK